MDFRNLTNEIAVLDCNESNVNCKCIKKIKRRSEDKNHVNTRSCSLSEDKLRWFSHENM